MPHKEQHMKIKRSVRKTTRKAAPCYGLLAINL
jgi:hypothetical protein